MGQGQAWLQEPRASYRRSATGHTFRESFRFSTERFTKSFTKTKTASRRLSGGSSKSKTDSDEEEDFSYLLNVTARELDAIIAVQRHWRGMHGRMLVARMMRIDHTFAMQEYLGKFRSKYMIATNRPENDEHWEDGSEQWLGRASMSKRHRFLIRRDLHWRWFNALVFGMLGNDGKFLAQYEHAKDTIPEIKRMKEAAMTYVTNARQCGEGWSENIGLYFHVYGHNSVNSMHLHILDLDFTGPTFEYLAYKNLSVDALIEGLTREAQCRLSEKMESTVATASGECTLHDVSIKSVMLRLCPNINDVESFLWARECLWRQGDPHVIQLALEKDGFLTEISPMLTTSTKPFNVFARLARIDETQEHVIRKLRRQLLFNTFKRAFKSRYSRLVLL